MVTLANCCGLLLSDVTMAYQPPEIGVGYVRAYGCPLLRLLTLTAITSTVEKESSNFKAPAVLVVAVIVFVLYTEYYVHVASVTYTLTMSFCRTPICSALFCVSSSNSRTYSPKLARMPLYLAPLYVLRPSTEYYAAI